MLAARVRHLSLISGPQPPRENFYRGPFSCLSSTRCLRFSSQRYAELPHALGCDGWFTACATTCGELDTVLEAAESSSAGTYIKVVSDAYAAPPLMRKLHDAMGLC